MKKFIAYAVFGIPLFLGCSILPSDKPAESYYLLRPELKVVESEKPTKKTIVVNRVESSPLIDSRRILYSSTSYTRSSYQLAFWTESPTNRMTALLADALRASKLYDQVVQDTIVPNADHGLSTSIEDFYFDTANNTNSVVLRLSLTVTDLKAQKEISTTKIEKRNHVDDVKIENVAASFNKVTSEALTDVVNWITESTYRTPSAP